MTILQLAGGRGGIEWTDDERSGDVVGFFYLVFFLFFCPLPGPVVVGVEVFQD